MINDLKIACRRLLNAPGFAAVAAMILALAIGANTAIFSFADAVLFRPLPYADPDGVHIIRMQNKRTGAHYMLVPFYVLREVNGHHRGLSAVGLIEIGPSVVVSTAGAVESVPTVAVNANYLNVLGVRPVRGRLFDDDDAARGSGAAILTHDAWRRWFGGDERVVGRTVTFGTATLDIVGVLPRDFMFPRAFPRKPQLVTLMPHVPLGTTDGAVYPIVRLATGITRKQAQKELDGITTRLAGRNPQSTDEVPVLEDVRSLLYPTGRPIMEFLVAAAALVLLIGCANLANMLLARTVKQERETGVRAALGANRIQLVRPLIFEAAIIGLVGATLAVLVTTVTFHTLVRLVPTIAYGNAPIGVDLRVVLFALGLGLCGGLLFAVAPAWRSAAMDVQKLIQGRHLVRGVRVGQVGRSIVALQVALAIVLVFGAVIAARAFVSVLQVPLGFTPENVITVQVRIPGLNGFDLQRFYLRAAGIVERRSDVVSTGAAGSIPLDGTAVNDHVQTLGAIGRGTGIVHVLPGYFETLGIRLIRGRHPDRYDLRSGTDVAVLEESAARTLFPGRDPLGGTFQNRAGRRFTVIGVVGDVRRSLERQPEPIAYVIPREETHLLTLVVRTRIRQEAVLADIKREMSALAPDTPVTVDWWVDSLSSVTAYRNPRFQTLVLGTFAVLALALTGLGIFGVISFLLAVRTHEMGVRMAMGAAPRSLVFLMVFQSLGPVIAGLFVGLVATGWLSRFAEAQLYQVDTRDPITLAVAASTVVAAAVVAAYMPARQAGRVDPMIVLRAE